MLVGIEWILKRRGKGRASRRKARNDGDFIQSLMHRVVEPGKFASWIAPPRVGIDNKPGDFEYVKLAA